MESIPKEGLVIADKCQQCNGKLDKNCRIFEKFIGFRDRMRVIKLVTICEECYNNLRD